MASSPKPIISEPSAVSLESIQVLKELDRTPRVDLPHSEQKYKMLGYLLQLGKIPSEDGSFKKLPSPDTNYIPEKRPQWRETFGKSTDIRIKSGENYSQEFDSFSGGELLLRMVSIPDLLPEILITFGATELKPKIERFLNLLVISFILPNRANPPKFILSIKNPSRTELVIHGVDKGLKVRFVESSEINRGGIKRKFVRGISLIQNGEYKALMRAVYFTGLGKINSIKRGLSLVLLSLTLFSCVLPPDNSGPRVFSKDEMNFITDFQKGISYSESGRFDRAEFHFRVALKSTQNPPVLLKSNLAFALRAQGKYNEAVELLNQVLKVEPHHLHARLILGRTYFELGDLDGAIREYKRVENEYYGYWNSNPDKRLTNNFDGHDLLSVMTNLAILYAQSGQIGESICYSQKALDLGNKDYKPQAHARFLISLEEYYLAGEVLRQVIFTGKQVTAPLPPSLLSEDPNIAPPTTAPEEDPSSIQDLGVVRFMEENYTLAGEAFDRVLTLTIVPDDQRLLTELLRYEVAQLQQDIETIELLNQSFSELSAELCESESYVTPPYWPIKLKSRVLESRKKICATYG